LKKKTPQNRIQMKAIKTKGRISPLLYISIHIVARSSSSNGGAAANRGKRNGKEKKWSSSRVNKE
jgi:hypothetical protein